MDVRVGGVRQDARRQNLIPGNGGRDRGGGVGAVGASLLPLMVMVKTPAPVVPWLSMTVQEKTSCRLSPGAQFPYRI